MKKRLFFLLFVFVLGISGPVFASDPPPPDRREPLPPPPLPANELISFLVVAGVFLAYKKVNEN